MIVIQNEVSKEVWIGQPAYTKNLFQKFGMGNAKAVKSPMDTCVMLEKLQRVKTVLINNCPVCCWWSTLFVNLNST